MAVRPLPIVATKLAPPADVKASVRPDTLARIKRGGAGRLLLVQAPAGYGKTTVIGEAARRLKWRAAWYKLDMLDQDVVVFVASLAESIRTVVPGFGSVVAERLADLRDAPLSTNEILGILAAEIAHETRDPLHIVLDDYHECANSAGLNAAMDYLLASAPPDVHFVVLTRYEPSFQLARLRLAGEVAIIQRDDLRFSARQVAEFLRRRGVRQDHVRELNYVLDMTEGWPAGLVLIANALGEKAFTAESAMADPLLKGDLYTYLAEEVYSTQSPDLRQFLRRSSVLEYMTPELAAAVAMTDDATDYLRHLTANCLFTFRTEEGNYRYHHLFRAYLKHKAIQQDGANAFREAQLRAAVALESAGDYVGACEQMLQLGRHVEALKLAVATNSGAVENYSTAALESWLYRLPPLLIDRNPYACLLRAQLKLRGRQFEESLHLAEEAFRYFEADDDINGKYHSLLAMESVLYWKGDYSRAVKCCRTVLQLPLSSSQRAYCLGSLAASLIHLADWQGAEDALSQAEAVVNHDDSLEYLRIICFIINSLLSQGRLIEGFSRAKWILPRFRGRHIGLYIAYLHLFSTLELLNGQYDSSRKHLDECLYLCGQHRYAHMEPFFQDLHGQLLLSTGSRHEGMEVLKMASNLDEVLEDPFSLSGCLCHLGTAYRRVGDMEAALAYYSEATRAIRQEPSICQVLLVESNQLYARGRQGEQKVLSALEAVGDHSRTLGIEGIESRCIVFAGILLAARDVSRSAKSNLNKGLSRLLLLGHRHFVCQELASLPNSLLEMVISMLAPQLARDVVHTLCLHWNRESLLAQMATLRAPVAAVALEEAARSLPASSATLVLRKGLSSPTGSIRKLAGDLLLSLPDVLEGSPFPELTPREVDILGLISEGLKNRDIQTRLFLSRSTVKTHINHIFFKLSVSDRTSAALLFRERTGGR